ncbi:citrate synthase [Colletotrichum plurivorum]|uniref:Citrate synthase n=1 Tax=Colletotrichum plurivorum TaxID=2175906 RepID=A0A8H6K186_9PEZI|nr:citrate synthase [Colletotrichum plurivorum]
MVPLFKFTNLLKRVPVSIGKHIWIKASQIAKLSEHLIYRFLGQPDLGPSSGTLTVIDNRTRRQYDIPIKRNAIKAVEFRKITSAQQGADPVDQIQTGLRVLDPGYLNTACVESKITLVDGQRGYIQYRDYPIEYLFENHNYEDVLHLLVWGHLPSAAERLAFRRRFALACVPPKHAVEVIQSFPRDSLTKTMIMAGLAAFASHEDGAEHTHQSSRPYYLGRPNEVDTGMVRTLGAFASVVALAYCHKRNKRFTMPDPEESYIGNVVVTARTGHGAVTVVRMMGFRESSSDVAPDRDIVACFSKLWILYADHEMTNSTAAFLHASSTLTDPLSCCISSIACAHGPLHGGAIDIAYRTFADVGTPENVPALIADVKAKKHRLFGYGHRIYKAVDPRAKFMRAMIDQHKDRVQSNPLLAVALEIDRVAGADEYFTSRKLKANADFYGCFLYTAFGFEADIIVAMACMSRLPGGLAHWRESMLERGPLIWRSQQIFTGKVAVES